MVPPAYMYSSYDKWFVEIKNNDSLDWFQTEINSILVHNIAPTLEYNTIIIDGKLKIFKYYKQNCTKQKLNLNDKWNLIYSKLWGCEYSYYLESFTGYLKTIEKSFNHCYIANSEVATLTTNEIFSEFNIIDTIPLCYCPYLLEDNDIVNNSWAAIMLNSDYVIIRKAVHNDIALNKYSCRERIYYFKKNNH